MWAKEIPRIEGFYWVKATHRMGLLTPTPTDEESYDIVSVGRDLIFHHIGSELALDPNEVEQMGWEFWSEPISPPHPSLSLLYEIGRGHGKGQGNARIFLNGIEIGKMIDGEYDFYPVKIAPDDIIEIKAL